MQSARGVRRSRALFPSSFHLVTLAVDNNDIPVNGGLSFCAGAHKHLPTIGSFQKVAVRKFLGTSDFDDLETFLDEIRRKLPELFKASVAVENGADVLCGVVSGDPEIICHDPFSFAVMPRFEFV